MTAAVFKATYSDWKLVKTRGVVQIVFEVPLAEADLAYKVVGGMPNIAAESWFGIARLRDSQDAAVSTPAAGETDAAAPAWDSAVSPPPSKQRKPVAPEKRLAQQAGICCADHRFQLFLGISMKSLGWSVFDEETASEAVRRLCGVDTRADIVLGSEAGEKWEKLYGKFLGWRDHDMSAHGAAA